MNRFAEEFSNFIRNETIFFISLILAIISCFFVLPNWNYLNYINYQTIILLFSVMLIVEILKNLTIFERISRKLLNEVKNTRKLVLLLVFSCFFSSIFITNDVSLIIFVPFTLLTLKKVNRSDLIMFTVALETVAANTGCMILPTGAPHNIVLYTQSHIAFQSFFLILLPYITVSMVFLAILIFFIPSDDIPSPKIVKISVNRKRFFKRVFSAIDYLLILTFIALFILIGNLENIPFFSSLFNRWISGNETVFAIISSQIISNVPAAVLMTGFSTNFKAIITGINIGSFGTLVASMANLISYKILISECSDFKVKYLILFTFLNTVLLLILFGGYCLFYA